MLRKFPSFVTAIVPLLAAVVLFTSVDLGWAGKHKLGKHKFIDPDRRKVVDVKLLGEVTFPTGYVFEDTEVGGLSGITYDARKDLYYALSDDRSDIDPARYYTVKIAIADGKLADGDIEFRNVITLRDQHGRPFSAGSIDPEGIARTCWGQLYISSEGDADNLIDPFVNKFSLWGRQIRELPVDPKFLPTPGGASGIRNNLAFESLTITPNGRYLYTAVENALVQDGPAADVEQESLARIVKYDLLTGEAVGEFVYTVGAVPEEPDPSDAFRTNGLVELLAIDNNGTLLALERAFSVGKGNTVKLYEVRTQGALDVIKESDLFWEEKGIAFEIDPPVAKRLLIDFAQLPITPDNLEGMTFGPKLRDGRQTLIVVSDNNFNSSQVTQFILLGLEMDTLPAARPLVETPRAIDEEGAASTLQGDSDDPAIWVHPKRPWKSLVIATQKDGGLVVFDLKGKVKQKILPAPFGAIRYNNVDLVYNFKLGRKYVDLAVVSDRENDTLAIYKIDPWHRRLVDVTDPDIIDSIFGVDDGEATAYGLCTYTSSEDGESYAFVTQADGNLVAQLRLLDNGSGAVKAEVARTLELPVPTGDPEDSQAEGIVADRELGHLYVALEEEVGILKFGAEPGDSKDYTTIVDYNEADFLVPDIEGLTIYYGPKKTGYLLVSSQGDSTFAVLDRKNPSNYLGSFVVADFLSIDQVNESDGLDVINVPLGPRFPFGLLVVQDGANDPQNVVQDDEELENNSTNFKFVPWQGVAKTFEEPLIIDPFGYNPRMSIYE
ncbi:MAG: phytase [Desulfobacterales bacterium]|jgi:myo-inositol-hexaphosphate 3-phosphohydrolase